MNTTFFQKASDYSRSFSWKDIFSDVFKVHTQEQKNRLLARGLHGNIPASSEMLTKWQKPWLFFRIAVVGIILAILSLAGWYIFGYSAMGSLSFLLPAFIMPVSALVFYWEMNIPADISLYNILFLMLLGGILSLLLTGIVHLFLPMLPDVAYISAPIPEEIAKFAITCAFMCLGTYKYGIHGILVGGAVGVGFSAIESAGYAWDAFNTSFLDPSLLLFHPEAAFSTATRNMALSQLIRGILSIGGHVVWAALYGGALGLFKSKKGKMTAECLADPLVLGTFFGAVLLHTFWNLSTMDLYGWLPDGFVYFYYRMESLFIKHVILIILAWIFMLYILRRCIYQMVEISINDIAGASCSAEKKQTLLTLTATGQLCHGRSYRLAEGGSLILGRSPSRANVVFPSDTRGVSGLHCEITMVDRRLVIIDRNSSYGTFLSDGTRLTPNVPYILRGDTRFYLANPVNEFTIRLLS